MPKKIHLYTIAKNEAQFCDRWVSSGADADGLHVFDTGSTDETVRILEDHGVHVKSGVFKPWKTLDEYRSIVKEGRMAPWRFDTARNTNLAMIPADADICLQIDMDEVLVPGWRDVLEKFWTEGVNRIGYLYAWSMDGDKPVRVFHYNKCHARHGFSWVRPVHEVIYPSKGTKEKFSYCNTLLVKHYPDGSKSRSSYLNLLELAHDEDPRGTQSCYYLAREYSFNRRWEDAIRVAKRYLEIENIDLQMERSAACLLIAKCHSELQNKFEQERWLLRAAAEAPNHREGWCDLADYYRITGQNAGGYFAAKRALSITANPMSHLSSPYAWREQAYDIASVCGWYAGLKEESVQLAWQALKKNPMDGRLIENYSIVKKSIYEGKVIREDEFVPVVDVIILSYSKDKEHYLMTRKCVESLMFSSVGIGLNIIVVETNSGLRDETFFLPGAFGFESGVIYPIGKFGYNRYLCEAHSWLSESRSKYIMILNNDVVEFSSDFIKKMVEAVKISPSVSPLGLREHTWSGIDESVELHFGYDVNREVSGWCIMFDKEILKTISFEELFPKEIVFYGQDIRYAEKLKENGIVHATTCAAQTLHLQSQSHELIENKSEYLSNSSPVD